MLKVAIMIRGHIRNVDNLVKNYEKILNIKDNNEYYIFIHTWKTLNYNNEIPIDIPYINKIFNPVSIIIDDQNEVINDIIFRQNANRAKFKFQLFSNTCEIRKKYI